MGTWQKFTIKQLEQERMENLLERMKVDDTIVIVYKESNSDAYSMIRHIILIAKVSLGSVEIHEEREKRVLKALEGIPDIAQKELIEIKRRFSDLFGREKFEERFLSERRYEMHIFGLEGKLLGRVVDYFVEGLGGAVYREIETGRIEREYGDKIKKIIITRLKDFPEILVQEEVESHKVQKLSSEMLGLMNGARDSNFIDGSKKYHWLWDKIGNLSKEIEKEKTFLFLNHLDI